MTERQKLQEKADKRAAALRNNLQKRKSFIKKTKETTQNHEEGKNAKS